MAASAFAHRQTLSHFGGECAGLVVTADDFGADVGVNEAVETAHRRGILTAASLMVGAPAAADAVARARASPSLAVGLHVVLVDGRPILPPEAVPHLVDRSGAFRNDMASAGARLAWRPAARRQLAAEIAAQFEAFGATGLRLDHVNAHKHFHLHPTIAGLILSIGARYGLRAARVPVEPHTVLRAVEPEAPRAMPSALNLLARATRIRFHRAGVMTPDQVFGLQWTGAMTSTRLRGLIEHLPGGLSEIYLHPGVATGHCPDEELAALIDPTVVAAVAARDIRLGSFSDFQSGAL